MVRRVDRHTIVRLPEAGGADVPPDAASSGSGSRGATSLRNLQIAYIALERMRPSPNNARTHSKKQIKQIARSIERFGFVNPVLITDDLEIIAGHGRLEAAKLLGLRQIPTVRLSSLSPAERRAYMIADNRLAELAGWDRELLATELKGLLELEFDDIELTGFSLPEIDLLLDEAPGEKATKVNAAAEDQLPAIGLHGPAVSRSGDLWVLGRHRLVCGDAADPATYRSLLAGAQADLVLTDPLSTVVIDGAAAGLGGAGNARPETAANGGPADATGSGDAILSREKSEDRLIAWVATFLQCAKDNAKAGAALFVFVDWRRLYALLAASRQAGLALADLVVWAKTDRAAAEGFYPSRHELVLVLRNGEAPCAGTVDAADTVRHRLSRSNVWRYAGVAGADAADDRAALHPTVKPATLVADAIRDTTRRGDIVLDPFAGAGTTIVAGEKIGRVVRAIERGPLCCDLIVRRWQQYAGKVARLEGSDVSFADVEAMRLVGRNAPDIQNQGSE